MRPLRVHSGTPNTNKNYDSPKSVRRSARKSKLPRYFKSKCFGVPEWMLGRTEPNSVSLAPIAKDAPANTENITDNSYKPFIPLQFKHRIRPRPRPNNQVSVPIRILISDSYIGDQIIRDERFPDAPTEAAATVELDSSHHEKNEEPEFRLEEPQLCLEEPEFRLEEPELRHEEPEFRLPEQDLLGSPENVASVVVKPNPRRNRRRGRINVATVKTTLSGRPLPSPVRYPRRTRNARIELKRQQMNDYPECEEQLAEMEALNTDILQIEREIMQREKNVSVLAGLIVEEEAKKARKRCLNSENLVESKVNSTGNRTEESDEANLFPSPTLSELDSAQHEMMNWFIDGIPSFRVEE